MSDPVTNVQIEDVLSSIRRLVSEEARPRRPASAPAPTAGRLVLSPALRVPDREPARADDAATPPMVLTAPAAVRMDNGVEDAVPPPPGALLLHDADRAEPEETLVDPAEDADLAQDDLVAEEDRSKADLSEGSAADHLTAAADPAEERLAEAEPLEDLRAELAGWFDDRLDDDTRDVQGLDAVLDGWAEDGEADSPAEEPAEDRDLAIERKIATLEQMLNRQSQGWTPAPEVGEAVDDTPVDDGATDVPGAETGVADLVQAEADAVPHVAAATDDTDETAAPEIDIPAVTEAARATSIPEEADTLVEGEAEPAVSHHAAEADMAEGKPAFVRHPGRPGPSALEWEDHAPTAVPQHPQGEQAVAPASTAVTELSEEALHAMVAEIIREELQGVLGERITRNVRKLVRREIHRVLMSKDFD